MQNMDNMFFHKNILIYISTFIDLYSMSNLMKTCKHYHKYKFILKQTYNTYVYCDMELLTPHDKKQMYEQVMTFCVAIKGLEHKFYNVDILRPNKNNTLKNNLVYYGSNNISLLFANQIIPKIEYLLRTFFDHVFDIIRVNTKNFYFKFGEHFIISLENASYYETYTRPLYVMFDLTKKINI